MSGFSDKKNRPFCWVAFGLWREGRLIEMVSWPLLIFVWGTINMYLPGYLSYELREEGLYLCSVLRRRTICLL